MVVVGVQYIGNVWMNVKIKKMQKQLLKPPDVKGQKVQDLFNNLTRGTGRTNMRGGW